MRCKIAWRLAYRVDTSTLDGGDYFPKRESRRTRELGCATSSGAILKLQIASDADGLDFLAKKLTIGVVTVVIINQHPKAS